MSKTGIAGATRRPHFVFLVDDQHRWDALGSIGPDEPTWLRPPNGISTPALDRLARTGVRFGQAVANVPVCVPSRHSFLTGMRGSQLGVLGNESFFFEDLPVPTIAEILRRHGYATASFGKMHWKPARAPREAVPDTRGFDVRATNDGEQTDGPSELRFEEVVPTPAELAERRRWPEVYGRGGENAAGYVGEVSDLRSDRFPEHWLTGLAVEHLRHLAQGDQPFFLMLSLDRPHPESVVPSDYADAYDPDDMPMPPRPESDVELDGHLRELTERLGWDRMDDAQVRTATARYLANVSFADDCFGRVLDALEELGLAEDTIVVYTSDHGEMLGERTRAFSKYCLYGSAARVPLIVRWPGVGRAGTVDSAPVELIDLLPTWLDAAGVGVPEYLPGRSLRSLIAGDPSEWRSVSISEHATGEYRAGEPRLQWAIRNGRYSLIERLGGRSALYDRDADPLEYADIIDAPDGEAIAGRLRHAALREVMRNAESYPARDRSAVSTI